MTKITLEVDAHKLSVVCAALAQFAHSMRVAMRWDKATDAEAFRTQICEAAVKATYEEQQSETEVAN